MEDGEGIGNTFGLTGAGAGKTSSPEDSILDIREYDVPYYLRVAIDKGTSNTLLYLLVNTDPLDFTQIFESGYGMKSKHIMEKLQSISSRSESVEPSL